MKILIIGQLPVEVGGKYTNGVCNVVYELSKCSSQDVKQYVYATNMDDIIARNIHSKTRYFGTILRPRNVLFNVLQRPLQTLRKWYYYKNVTHMSVIRNEFYYDNFTRIIQKVKPDIIHCMNIVQLAPLHFAAKEFRIPIVTTLHGVFTNMQDDKDLQEGNIMLSNYTTGLTAETMAGIVKMGFPASKSFLIPNGTDTSKFYYDNNERVKLRKILGLDNETTMMVTVGSLQHRKGQYSFCKILKDLPNSFKYHYYIIGSGPDKDKINKYIIDNGLQDKISIIGYIENTELYKYYSSADLYIHCSYAEGQALSEVEAFATDLKIAVNRDIVDTVVTDTKNERDYFIFEYNHFENEEFVNWAKNHKNNRRTRKQYDWNSIYKMYVCMYKKILKDEND